MNSHDWFHLHWLRWAIRKGGGPKIQNENICLQRDSNPRHATQLQENQRFRPLGHNALMTISGLMSYRIVGYKLIKRKREGDLTQSYDKTPFTNRKFENQRTTHKRQQKTPITPRLRTDLGRSVGVTMKLLCDNTCQIDYYNMWIWTVRLNLRFLSKCRF